MIAITVSKLRFTLRAGIQSRTNEDQDGRGQEDDSIVETPDRTRSYCGKHASAQGVDDVVKGFR